MTAAAALLVALAAFAVAAVATLLVLALVLIASGGRSLSVGAHPLGAALAGAGFACADTAAVLAVCRRGRLRPGAPAAVWVLSLLVAAPGAGAVGAAAAIAGGALAIRLGAGRAAARASWRAPACLAAGGCALVTIAAAIAALPHVRRPPPRAAARADVAPARASRSPAPAVDAASSSSATPAVAARIVRDFYAALDAHRFARAWAQLSAPVQTGFGGFTAWRAGYRTTISSRPRSIRVTAAAGGLLVRHTLVAVDRTPCGTRSIRRFAVRWWLVPSGSRLRAASLTAAVLPGGATAGACLVPDRAGPPPAASALAWPPRPRSGQPTLRATPPRSA